MFSPPPSTFFQVSHCPSVPPAAKAYYVFSSSLYYFFKCPTVPQSHQLLKHTLCSPLLCTFFSSVLLSLSPTSCQSILCVLLFPLLFFQVSHCPSVPPAAKAYYVFSSSLYFFFKCPTVPQSHQLLNHTMFSPPPSTFFSSVPLSLSPTSC